MKLTNKENSMLLKIFSAYLKEAFGRGPRNIYLHCNNHQLIFTIQGIMTPFEKHLLIQQGNDVEIFFKKYYQTDCFTAEHYLLNNINFQYYLKFHRLETDFVRDEFQYIMTISK